MKKPNQVEKLALAVTRWIGSPASIALHTVLFAATIALLVSKVFPFEVVILIFNTAISLEAIYLALFIQLTVNFQAENIEEVGEDIEEIQGDLSEIQEDVGELQENVEEISEDVGEITAEETSLEQVGMKRVAEQEKILADIQTDLRKIMAEISKLRLPNQSSSPNG